ncbi:MAG: isochorismatase family protein [Planctomycetota bacterium]|nr:MAG: isochorismatase family protein [Planctomycetota bacterium]
MFRQLRKLQRRQILIDIDTQRDFLLGGGRASIRNHKGVLANVRRMMAWARHRGIRIISTCEVHRNNNGYSAYDYCLDGTAGQQKIRYTILDKRASFGADSHGDLPFDLLWANRQIIFHKRCADPFDEPRIDRVLSEVEADEFILIGAAAEGAVKATALGLLRRGKRVSIVVDAVGSHNKRDAKLAFQMMEAMGARLTETKEVAGVSHLKGTRICDCASCKVCRRRQTLEIGGTNEGYDYFHWSGEAG